jgi:thioredoxin 1
MTPPRLQALDGLAARTNLSLHSAPARALVMRCMRSTGMIEINDKAKFDEAIRAHKLVVVDFHAPWCGPTKKIAPLVQHLSEARKDVYFFKTDVDQAEALVESWNITGMPTFLFFKDGHKVDELVGANEGQLTDKVNKLK